MLDSQRLQENNYSRIVITMRRVVVLLKSYDSGKIIGFMLK